MRRPFGKLWLDTFFARKDTEKFPDKDLSGKLIIFTGGTDGMGLTAVERFAEMGADICLFGRDVPKTQAVVDNLTAKGFKGQFSFIECDLSSLNQVRRAVDQVLSQFRQIDYLINCAGINIAERRLSPDGYEFNFAVNYLGTFLLTELLLGRIKEATNARIVQLVSGTQEVAKLNFDDIQMEKNWSMLASYAQAKLCLIMHARYLAKQLEGSDVTILSLNPGYIKTNLTRHAKGIESLFMKLFGSLASPTWVGGERIVAATLDGKYDHHSGDFVYEDMVLKPNSLALDDTQVEKLIEMSHRLTRLNQIQINREDIA